MRLIVDALLSPLSRYVYRRNEIMHETDEILPETYSCDVSPVNCCLLQC